MQDIEDQEIHDGARAALPSSPTDRKKLKTMLSEATYCKQRIDDEKENIKAIAERIQQEFEIPKKLTNKIINVLYKQNYADRVAEEEDFQFLYEGIVATKVDGTPTGKKDDKASSEEIDEIRKLLESPGLLNEFLNNGNEGDADAE